MDQTRTLISRSPEPQYSQNLLPSRVTGAPQLGQVTPTAVAPPCSRAASCMYTNSVLDLVWTLRSRLPLTNSPAAFSV